MQQIYIKNAKIEEINNLKYIESLGLNNIAPNYFVSQQKIIYKKEKKLPVAAKFDIVIFDILCRDILNVLYSVKNNRFSEGIYSYINYDFPYELENTKEKLYFAYLKKEFIGIIKKYGIKKVLDGNQTMKELYEIVVSKLDSYNKKYQVSEFSLLHGDFHIGNIVFSKSEGKYKCIDFEYLRYGIPELEIANFVVQLLDGGTYIEPHFSEYLSYVLKTSEKNCRTNSNIIMELFIPMFLFFRVWRCIGEVNNKQILVKETVLNISRDYLGGRFNECLVNYSSI